MKRICDVVGAAIYDYQPHTFDVDIREAKESLSARDPPPPSSGTPPDFHSSVPRALDAAACGRQPRDARTGLARAVRFDTARCACVSPQEHSAILMASEKEIRSELTQVNRQLQVGTPRNGHRSSLWLFGSTPCGTFLCRAQWNRSTKVGEASPGLPGSVGLAAEHRLCYSHNRGCG